MLQCSYFGLNAYLMISGQRFQSDTSSRKNFIGNWGPDTAGVAVGIWEKGALPEGR